MDHSVLGCGTDCTHDSTRRVAVTRRVRYQSYAAASSTSRANTCPSVWEQWRRCSGGGRDRERRTGICVSAVPGLLRGHETKCDHL